MHVARIALPSIHRSERRFPHRVRVEEEADHRAGGAGIEIQAVNVQRPDAHMMVAR